MSIIPYSLHTYAYMSLLISSSLSLVRNKNYCTPNEAQFRLRAAFLAKPLEIQIVASLPAGQTLPLTQALSVLSLTCSCKKDSYDLSRTMIASTALLSKNTLFPREERWRSGRGGSPSPDAYHHRSFTDLNRQVERGNGFGTTEKMRRVDKNNVPGPGSYQ
jgi:hypothetical protein